MPVAFKYYPMLRLVRPLRAGGLLLRLRRGYMIDDIQELPSDQKKLLFPKPSAKEDQMTPQKVVEYLDRFVIGQADAKRAIAVSFRNRWRRKGLPDNVKKEITPKNILMQGPTGCGKTELARRLANLTDAPFLRVEATKYTEIGYVGKDVSSIIQGEHFAIRRPRKGLLRHLQGQDGRAAPLDGGPADRHGLQPNPQLHDRAGDEGH